MFRQRKLVWCLTVQARQAACLALAFAAISSGQLIPPPDKVTINDPRPLTKVAEMFGARYGVRVSYEDVSAYNYEGDLDKSTKLPRSSSLSISFAGFPQPEYSDKVAYDLRAQKTGDPVSMKRLLQAILNEHERSGNPGRFKIVDTENGMVIVPTATRDSAGMFVPDQSVLDQRISFPEETMRLDLALNRFCSALSSATGKNIYFHDGPEAINVRIGAKDEVARDVLARMFNTQRWNGMGITINSIGEPALEATWALTTEPDGYKLVAAQVEITFSFGLAGNSQLPIPLPKRP
jgi:hypothetical protein